MTADLIPFTEDPATLTALALERAQAAEVAKWERFAGDMVTPEQLDPWFAFSDLPVIGEEKRQLIDLGIHFAVLGINGPIQSKDDDGRDLAEKHYWMLACLLPTLKKNAILTINGTGSNERAIVKMQPVCAAGKMSGWWCLRELPSGKGKNPFIALSPWKAPTTSTVKQV